VPYKYWGEGLATNLVAEDLYRISNQEVYLPPEKMALHLSHRDLQLDYFITRQSAISQLMSGEELILGSAECMNSRGASVLRFSNQFMSTIESKKQLGYFPKKCNVNFIVFWHKEGSEQEVKIILPVLYFEKRQ
jgi:ATP-dependent DNA helicase RecQ